MVILDSPAYRGIQALVAQVFLDIQVLADCQDIQVSVGNQAHRVTPALVARVVTLGSQVYQVTQDFPDLE